MPKGRDLSKAIDKKLGATRASPNVPATREAAAWQGVNTQLKPAYEPAVLCMKPLDGTCEENALKHGVAGLAIDACRVGTTKDVPWSPSKNKRRFSNGWRFSAQDGTNDGANPNIGRWPANLILDGAEAAAALDEQVIDSGQRCARGDSGGMRRKTSSTFFGRGGESEEKPVGFGDGKPGASRFFAQCAADEPALRFKYASKVSPRERNAGLPSGETNRHQTLKPISLTTYFARLLLPPSTGRPRRILVPFSGAGSEMIGALLAGWDEIVGIELSPDHVRIAEARLGHWQAKRAS